MCRVSLVSDRCRPDGIAGARDFRPGRLRAQSVAHQAVTGDPDRSFAGTMTMMACTPAGVGHRTAFPRRPAPRAAAPGPSGHGAAEPGSNTTSECPPATAGGPDDPQGQVLPCGGAIATTDGASPGHSIVLDQVALPTDVVLQANASGDEDAAARLFAKDELLIRG